MQTLNRWSKLAWLFFASAGIVGAVYGATRLWSDAFPAPALAGTPPATAGAVPGSPGRIVSLAPSLTEVLFAIGAGDQIVGVTRYCHFPPEAQSRTPVGGMTDTDYETLVGLRPDLVVLRSNALQESQREHCAQLKLPLCIVSDDTIECILGTIASLGDRTGHPARAAQLEADLRARMTRLQSSVPSGKRSRVLMIVGRTVGLSSLKEVYAAGPHTFLDEVLALAGGQNALADDAPPFPRLGPEDIVRLDPDVIVDLFTPEAVHGANAEVIAGDWRQLPSVGAVKAGRVHVVVASYAMIPGPRFILLAENLAQLMRESSKPAVEAATP